MEKILKQIKNFLFINQLNVKRIIRILMHEKIYYVIGDSHSTNFLHEAFIIKHIGPATAYRLKFINSLTQSNKKIFNILDSIYRNKQINVLFIFGEIDARIHVYNFSMEKKVSLHKAIDNTLKSYVTFLNSIKKKYPLINIYVFNILPTGEQKNIYKARYYANRIIRSKITEEINMKLEELSRKNGFKFLNIYNYLIKKNGKRKKEYIFDEAHYNRKTLPLILNELSKLG